MAKSKVTAGERHGSWTVLAREGAGTSREALFRCRCDCGLEKIVRGSCLIRGRSQACATCANRGKNTTHGLTGTPEYASWNAMRNRCLNPENSHFRHYGGRGITICDRWLNSAEAFASDMGARPSFAHSLDRIDNNGNYEPANCRWATKSEQRRNQRSRKELSC